MAEKLRVLVNPHSGRRERVWVFDHEVGCDGCEAVIVAGTGARRYNRGPDGYRFHHQDGRLCSVFSRAKLAELHASGLI